MHPGVVKVIAVYAPGLVKNFGPLGGGLYFYLQRVGIEHAFARFGFFAGIADIIFLIGKVQHLFAIGRKVIPVHIDDFVIGTFFKAVLVHFAGAGSIYASTTKDGPMKAKHEFELIAFEPSTRIRWKELSKTTPVFVPEGGYDLEPAGEGTRLTFFNILEGRGVLGKLLAPVALRSARKGADAFAASIKAAVEAS